LATRHGKEAVIAPALAPLGLTVQVTDAVDTDAFGTFTGTVPRVGTMRDAALAKCRAGLAAMPQAEFAVASEGAFGPHPLAPFATADLELVLLCSRDGTLEVSAEHVAVDVPAVARVAQTLDDALAIAEAAGFPDHALVVRDGAEVASRAAPRAMAVRDRAALERAVADALATAGAAVVANDLRAHANPSRMRAIGTAAQALADMLRQRCPQCSRPGIVTDPVPGLPCAICATATSAIGADERRCLGCGWHERQRRDGQADPARCPRCNP
jgi:predicted Zn-ribbon and HTH transcriptional regulator